MNIVYFFYKIDEQAGCLADYFSRTAYNAPK